MCIAFAPRTAGAKKRGQRLGTLSKPRASNLFGIFIFGCILTHFALFYKVICHEDMHATFMMERGLFSFYHKTTGTEGGAAAQQQQHVEWPSSLGFCTTGGWPTEVILTAQDSPMQVFVYEMEKIKDQDKLAILVAAVSDEKGTTTTRLFQKVQKYLKCDFRVGDISQNAKREPIHRSSAEVAILAADENKKEIVARITCDLPSPTSVFNKTWSEYHANVVLPQAIQVSGMTQDRHRVKEMYNWLHWQLSLPGLQSLTDTKARSWIASPSLPICDTTQTVPAESVYVDRKPSADDYGPREEVADAFRSETVCLCLAPTSAESAFDKWTKSSIDEWIYYQRNIVGFTNVFYLDPFGENLVMRHPELSPLLRSGLTHVPHMPVRTSLNAALSKGLVAAALSTERCSMMARQRNITFVFSVTDPMDLIVPLLRRMNLLPETLGSVFNKDCLETVQVPSMTWSVEDNDGDTHCEDNEPWCSLPDSLDSISSFLFSGRSVALKEARSSGYRLYPSSMNARLSSNKSCNKTATLPENMFRVIHKSLLGGGMNRKQQTSPSSDEVETIWTAVQSIASWVRHDIQVAMKLKKRAFRFRRNAMSDSTWIPFSHAQSAKLRSCRAFGDKGPQFGEAIVRERFSSSRKRVLLRLSFYNAETVKSPITGLQALSLSVYVESNDSIEKSIFKQWGGLSPSNSVADILPDVKCVYSHSDPVKIELGLTRQLETKGKWRKLEGLLTWLECPLPEKLPLTGKQESVVAAVTIEPIESENFPPSVDFLTTRKVDLCLGAEDKGGSCDGVSVACKVGCIDDLKDESDPQAQCCSRCHEAHDNYQRLDERDFWTPQNSAIATKVMPNSNGRFKKAGVHSKEDPRESRNGVFEKSGDLSICLRPFFTETTSRENDNIDPPSPQRVIEWLEYHLLIGFDVVYVLDRYGSSLLPFLEPYVSAGRVLHVPFPFLSNVPLSSDARSSQTTFIPSAHDQIIAYDLCLSIGRRRNDFFTAFIDLDEFVRYPQTEAGRLRVSIKELLSNQTDLPDQIFMDRYDVETDWKGFALRHTSRFLEPRLDLKKDGKAHGKVVLNPHSFVYGGALIHRSTRSGSGSVSSIAGGNALSIFHYRPYNMDREVTDMQRGKKGTDTSLQWAHVILSAQFIASAGWRSMKSLSRQGLLRLESVRPPLASGSKPETRPLLFIGILSYCADRDRRDAIRQTWLSSEALEASKTILNVEWKFVLGQESPTEQSPNCQEQALKGEREKLDDILFFPDLNETYQVLTRKTLAMFKWANENVDADFVLKTDDDSYINILAFASDLQQVESPDRPLYWGNHQILSTWLTAQFDIAPKWYIEPEDYPTDSQTYATGAGYLLSRPLVRHLADAISLDSDIHVPWGPEDRMGWLEDASVGYLLRGAVNRASRVVATGIQDTWFHLKCDTENFVVHHVNSSLQMDLHPLLLPIRDLSLEACKQLKSYETELPKARPGERALATKWGGSFLDRPASPLSIAGPPPFDVPQLSSASANKGSFDGRDVVVVTGSHHNIGRYFVEKLLQGYSRISGPLTILMLDSSEWTGGSIPHSDMNIHSDIQKVDITDYKALLSKLVAYEGRIRGVVHLAAVSRVQDCHLNMTWCKEVNVNATKNILKALWTLYGQEAAAVDSSLLPTPLPWLVFASSREVYGSLGPNDVITEKAPLRPLNIYGETKLWAENAIRQWTINTGFNAIVARFTNVYGSCHDHQSRLVPNLVSKLAANERFDIFGSADKTISLLHVQDAVQALILSMKYADTLPNRAGTFEPFNIGGGPEHDALNMKDIVRIAQTAVASASPNCKFCYHSAEFRVLRGKNKDRSPEPDHFRSSIEKAFRVLGYQPSRTFDIETIVEYINTCVSKESA